MIALAPTVLFLVLDAYYLSLEGAFRKSYDVFVAKVHSGQASTSDLYTIAPAAPSPEDSSRLCSDRSRYYPSTLW